MLVENTDLINYNTIMAKRVLVSGGAGYIGSHVTVELINAGYEVVVADNMSNCDLTCFEGVKKITGKEDIPFEKMDCCDDAAVNALFSKYRIDAVIHFAAFKAVGESVAEPIKYYRNNLDSFLNILEAAKTHGGCNVLFSSSATVYGETDRLPVTEQSPRQPATSPYGNTKQICEDILRDVVKATASCDAMEPGTDRNGTVKGIALRYFNPIGAHPSALIGELPRADGTCQRDYIDIVDLAKAHVAAVGRMLDGKMKESYEIFNVGTGRPVSVLELVNAFEKVNNLKLNYKFAPRRPGDVTAIWADPTLANRELGWKAGRSIEDTLAAAWAWEKHLAGK